MFFLGRYAPCGGTHCAVVGGGALVINIVDNWTSYKRNGENKRKGKKSSTSPSKNKINTKVRIIQPSTDTPPLVVC